MAQDNILLRKLTLKSKMDGINTTYHGWTVDQMIKFKPYILLKIYYNFQKISFTDEVFDLLRIIFKNFIEIEKPGIEPSFYESVAGKERTLEEIKKLIDYLRISKKQIPEWLIQLYYTKKNDRKVSKDPNPSFSKTKLKNMHQKLRKK